MTIMQSRPVIAVAFFLLIVMMSSGVLGQSTTETSTTIMTTGTGASSTTSAASSTVAGGNTTTTTYPRTTTTTRARTPAPTTPRAPQGFTAAPRPTSTFTTRPTTTSTIPPTTTLAANIEATYTQVDVFFDIFFDQYLQDYLTLFFQLSGVKSIRRVQIIEYQGFPSAVTGDGYIMSLQFVQPLDLSDDPLGAEAASTALEEKLNIGDTTADERIARHGIKRAVRVGPAKRETEKNGSGVNFMWLVLWFLTVFLMIVSIGALFRKRSAESVEEEGGGGGGGGSSGGGMSIPADDTGLARIKLGELVEAAEKKRQEREAKRLEEIKYAPSPQLFAATLEYENRVKLPPVGGLRMAKRREVKEEDGHEMSKQAAGDSGGAEGGDSSKVRDAASAGDSRSTNSGEGNGENKTPPNGTDAAVVAAPASVASAQPPLLAASEPIRGAAVEPLEANPKLTKEVQPLVPIGAQALRHDVTIDL